MAQFLLWLKGKHKGINMVYESTTIDCGKFCLRISVPEGKGNRVELMATIRDVGDSPCYLTQDHAKELSKYILECADVAERRAATSDAA